MVLIVCFVVWLLVCLLVLALCRAAAEGDRRQDVERPRVGVPDGEYRTTHGRKLRTHPTARKRRNGRWE